MNKLIKELIKESGGVGHDDDGNEITPILVGSSLEKFAELIVKECADICMELAAKCAGLPSEGALAVDCANLIKQDFGVDE